MEKLNIWGFTEMRFLVSLDLYLRRGGCLFGSRTISRMGYCMEGRGLGLGGHRKPLDPALALALGQDRDPGLGM